MKRNLWYTRSVPNPAGRGASHVRTQGQVTLGPDLVAIRIPAPVLASQVPVVAAQAHLRQELTNLARPTVATMGQQGVGEWVGWLCSQQ